MYKTPLHSYINIEFSEEIKKNKTIPFVTATKRIPKNKLNKICEGPIH